MRHARPAAALLAALASAAALGGCVVPPPQGEGTLRYRDAIATDVVVDTDVQYGQAPDLAGDPVDLKLDVYRPAGDTVTKRPALIWVHGGGFHSGRKGGGWTEPFAKLGYVGFTIDYRLLAEPACSQRPTDPACRVAAIAAQHDAQAAVRFVRRNAARYGVDPDRIAIGGGSAGAVTSVIVGRLPEDPGDSGNPGFSSEVRGVVSVSGGTPTDEAITTGDAPTLFLHGTADPVVPYAWAVSNATAMIRAGVPAILDPIEGGVHGLRKTDMPFLLDQGRNFLYNALDLAHAAGSPGVG